MIDKSMVGREIFSVTFPVEKGKIREFAKAIYEDNPIYTDEEYARKTKLGGIIAPPTFTEVSAFYTGQSEMTLDLEAVAFALDAGREFEYLEPIFAGDVLTATKKVADVYEKDGRRGGRMTFTVHETVYTNQKGHKVLIVRSTGIRTSQPLAE